MRRSEPVTKQEIVDVAARLFEEHGFARTRAEDVANALNIAKPTLYSRTTGKAELLEAVIDQVMEALGEGALAALDGQPTAFKKLEAIFDHHMRQAMQYTSYFNVFFRDDRELPPAVQRKFRRRARDYTRRIAALVEEAQRDGDIGGDVDPELAANTLLAVANWVCRWYDPDGPRSREEIAAASWQMLRGGIAQAKRARPGIQKGRQSRGAVR